MASFDFKDLMIVDQRPGEDPLTKYRRLRSKKINESTDLNELSMKRDKKLPNLIVPAKGKKGVSKFMRKKAAAQAKDDINSSVQSADRKPEKYTKPDGKVGVRMVKTDKEVINKEATVLKPKSTMDIVKHAKTLAKNPRDYMMNKKKYLDKARAKVFKMYPREAINHDDAHRDAQTHSNGSMSVKKIPSMIKKSGDKHLHLHMKSYHKEKDGQDFAKKHGYKVKNYVKTQSGTRMDIHKEMVDPMDLRGRPKKRDPYPKSPYGLKHPLHPSNIAKRKAKEAEKNKKESVDEAIKNLSSADQVKAAIKIIRDKRFNMRSQIDKKTAIQKISKDLLKDPKVKKEMDKIYEENVEEALTLQQRMKRSRLMKRMKTRIKIGRERAKRKMANKDKLLRRARRQARDQIARKLTRGIPKKELTFARKKEIEKRLEKPALQARINRIAKRMFKDVRKAEVQRKKG